ncbi:hypothetical protein V5O48_000619 [Marasmius crinis-equi]|uniref:Uncharacterized protein n=1 Tax=Marasmius crinis-equi TaxID=585013 RepID=A0ABR3G0Y9_9AGAR
MPHDPCEENVDVVEKEETNMNKPVRSKERRRRGRDPMKELLKGGKKAKELNKLISTISLDPSSSHSRRETSRSRPSVPNHEPRSSTGARDASVSSFVSTSSRTDEDLDHDSHMFGSRNTDPSSSSTVIADPEGAREDTTAVDLIPSHDSIPSLSVSAFAVSEDSLFAATGPHTYGTISSHPHLSLGDIPFPNSGPSLSKSHSLPHSSSETSHDHHRREDEPSLHGRSSPNPQLHGVSSRDHSTASSNTADRINAAASVPASISEPRREGILRNASTSDGLSAPTTNVKRGRKRNKSPVPLAAESNTPKHLSGSHASFNTNTTEAAQSQTPPLSTQTQLASLRGALEAARLREEKTRGEIEALKWEVDMARRKESDYRNYMNYLSNQLHSYASFAMNLQMNGGQLPVQHPHVSPYPPPTNAAHSPAGSIGSSSASGSVSITNEQTFPAFGTSQPNTRPGSRAGTPLRDTNLPATMPGTSLPSPPPSDTVSSPTLPSSSLEPTPTHPPFQIYATSDHPASTSPPEPSSEPATVPAPRPMPFEAHPHPPFFMSPPHASPVSPQSSPFLPPWGYEAMMANNFATMAGMSHLNYGSNRFMHGPFQPPLPVSPGMQPAHGLSRPGSGTGKSRSRSGKKTVREKRDRERDTTMTSVPPSPTPANTKFDVGSVLASRTEPSESSVSSPSSSLPSTPSSRSRSQQSHRNLVIPEMTPFVTSQSPSPLEVLGLNMDRLRDTSRGRPGGSQTHPSADSPKNTYARSGLAYHGEYLEASEHSNDLHAGVRNGYGEQGTDDVESGSFSTLLADAILKRPETMRAPSSRRWEDRTVQEHGVTITPEPVVDKESETSSPDGETEVLEDPIVEFTFPSLSNWGNVGSMKKDRPAEDEKRASEVWDEKAPSSPPPTPPTTKESHDRLDCPNA